MPTSPTITLRAIMRTAALCITASMLALSPASAQPSAGTSIARTVASPLSLLPEGDEKRRFLLDCTGCHQMDPARLLPAGRARPVAEWATIVNRMLGFAGATSGFPVIANDRDALSTAAWLERYLRDKTVPAVSPPATLRFLAHEVREYPVSSAPDLPHDVAVDARGRVVITGMFTHRMIVLDPATGAEEFVPIPVQGANPRAVEIDGAGRWWVVLGAPHKLARFDPARPAASAWDIFDVGFYAHSVALDANAHESGTAWVNGHFTRAPETIAGVNASSRAVRAVNVPSHPALANEPGGPIPYEIRVAPDGVVWMSELAGNRLVAHDPRSGAQRTITMPEPHMGPRRFDIDRDGVLWVPAYSGNALVRIDPAVAGAPGAAAGAGTTIYRLPLGDMLPYVARVEPSGRGLWIGTGTSGLALRFDFTTREFEAVQLPGDGVMVRHLAFDARSNDVWLAYGASPGTVSRVARIRGAAR